MALGFCLIDFGTKGNSSAEPSGEDWFALQLTGMTSSKSRLLSRNQPEITASFCVPKPIVDRLIRFNLFGISDQIAERQDSSVAAIGTKGAKKLKCKRRVCPGAI